MKPGHEPKIAALIAYQEGLLSEGGRRRVERHLSGCEVCRDAIASMRVYDELVEGLRGLTPDPDWSKMELRLRREAREVSRQIISVDPKPAPLSLLAAVALAAAVIPLLLSQPPRTEPDTASMAAAPTMPERGAARGEITLVKGEVLRETFAGVRPLAVGEALEEAEILQLRGRSEAHVRLQDHTGIVLEGPTRLQLAHLREGQVQLELFEGTISSEVAPLAEGDHYSVTAGPWRVEVLGTRFRVWTDGRSLGVRVDEGTVSISRDGRVMRVLEAPASFGTASGERVRSPVAISPASQGWPLLRIPPLAVDTLTVGGLELGAGGNVALRVPPGEVALAGSGQELSFDTLVQVETDYHFSAPALTPQAPTRQHGYLPPELIAPVVRAGQRRMTRCQEQADRAGQTITGRFTLQVTIGRTGVVQHARLVTSGERPPPCLPQLHP